MNNLLSISFRYSYGISKSVASYDRQFMKIGLTILILLSALSSTGQTIERIVVTSRMADEPPTRQGANEYQLEFKKYKDGQLIAKEYQVNNKRRKLGQSTLIPQEKVAAVGKWIANNKNSFRLHDFDLTYSALALHADTSKHDLTFHIPSDILFSVDSFKFCQEYLLKKSISTGGFTIDVRLIDASGNNTVFSFDSNDVGGGKFDLLGYLMSFKIFGDVISNEFPLYDFFSKKNLVKVLLLYQKTVECEGYYYSEFIKEYPNRSSLENRMMVGWNFADYMDHKSDSVYCHSKIDTLTNKVVYTAGDVMPVPVEGYQTLFDELRKIKYPHYSYHEGKQVFGFIVQSDGTIIGHRILKGIDNANWCNQVFEAITRVKWKPGKCNGSSVDMILVLPIIVHTK